MRARERRWEAPLLAKDLIEQAAQKRTYILRVLYGGVLFSLGLYYLYGNFTPDASAVSASLGAGRVLFETVIFCQLIGIYLLLPVLVSGSITQEKERGSLALLLLTHLRPTSILLEKLVARSIPMISMLIVSLPILAVAYAHGGISYDDIAGGALMLLVTTLHMGAFCVFCSAYCRSSLGALIATYLLYFPVGWIALLPLQPLIWIGIATSGSDAIHSTFSTWAIYESSTDNYTSAIIISAAWSLSAVLFLIFARVQLVRRAFLPPRNFLLDLFRRLDNWFDALNREYFRGRHILRPIGLPKLRPVAWRELTRRSIGQPAHLIRAFIVLESPVVLACYPSLDHVRLLRITDALLAFGWILGGVVVAAIAASAFHTERNRRTLSILLTTPLSTREVIHQKWMAILPFSGVFGVVLLSILSFKSYYLFQRYPDGVWAQYLAASIVAMFVLLFMVSWLSLWVGIRTPNLFRAFLTMTLVFAFWIILPAATTLSGLRELTAAESIILSLASPAWIITTIDDTFVSRSPQLPGGLLGGVFSILWWTGVAALFRHLSVRDADHHLGRA